MSASLNPMAHSFDAPSLFFIGSRRPYRKNVDTLHPSHPLAGTDVCLLDVTGCVSGNVGVALSPYWKNFLKKKSSSLQGKLFGNGDYCAFSSPFLSRVSCSRHMVRSEWLLPNLVCVRFPRHNPLVLTYNPFNLPEATAVGTNMHCCIMNSG